LREIPYSDPLDLFSRLYSNHRDLYLLESIEAQSRLAEFSFIGFSPRKMVSIRGGISECLDGPARCTKNIKGKDVFAAIRAEVGRTKVSGVPFRLAGGAVGFISYDSIRYWERLPETAHDDLEMPDIEMGIYDDGIVFDHARRKAYYYYLNESHFSQLDGLISSGGGRASEKFSFSTPTSNISKEDFENSVLRAKGYITDGDIFQVVLSRRLEFRVHGSLIRFYRALREINPSPYMFFLKHGESRLVGSSPEMLMRVEGRSVETYPIAGTRPVMGDPCMDRKLGDELLTDPKERAEHVMLVDLARNDVGRVSEFGSVSVPEFMTVHQFSHVQHIVSRVKGRLSSSCDCFDAFKAMMPAGTLSGAPKVRAMEIIEELEGSRRGPYGGAVGYFSFNGNADFAITIRTLIARGEEAFIQVGAGIVADSDPEREWLETEQKAGALMKALAKAGECQ
jgi:anthranilate synthase component 1